MDTNKMREQFEKFALSKIGGLSAGHLVKGEDGEYLNYASQCYWLFWQASREAVVVELPPKISAHNTSESGWVRPEAEHYDEAVDDCREAIEAHGLKVAP